MTEGWTIAVAGSAIGHSRDGLLTRNVAERTADIADVREAKCRSHHAARRVYPVTSPRDR
jgi:hypothetical protein